MFRKMRRAKQQLSTEETIAILERNTSGTLALSHADGYPYAVPISYVYHDHAIFFHGAKSGHKIDAMRHCDKASFAVIDRDHIVPEAYTTYFRSAIVFGKITMLTDPEEIAAAIHILAEKYRPGYLAERKKEIEKTFPALCVMKLEIAHMTGKQAIELVHAK